MRVRSVGHAVFAATMIALGIMALIHGNFAPVWSPVPKGVPLRMGLVYVCAAISLATGAGLLWKRTAAGAARVLLAWFVLWFLAFRLANMLPTANVLVAWYGCAETAVMLAGAWVLYTWFATDWDQRRLGFVSGGRGLFLARALYGVALIFFGTAHFVYLKETVADIPGWLPWHVAWAYFTGSAFIAAGLAVLAGVCARLAAALATAQIGVFVLLVWAPIVAAGSASAFDISETIVSAALMAGAWVIADSYSGLPCFAAGKRRSLIG